MINASYDKEFVFQDGVRTKNLAELSMKIERLNDEEFFSFVNNQKNDFSNWIEHVLLDKDLSLRLRNVKSKQDTLYLIRDRISEIHAHDALLRLSQKTAQNSTLTSKNTSIIESDASKRQVSDSLLHVSVQSTSKENTFQANVSKKVDSSRISQGAKSAILFALETVKKTPSKLKEHKAKIFKVFKKDGESVSVKDLDSSSKTKQEYSVEKEIKHKDALMKNYDSNESKIDEKKIIDSNIHKNSSHVTASPHASSTTSHVSHHTNHSEALNNEEKENVLWMILYVILIILILGLLGYKLFLQ